MQKLAVFVFLLSSSFLFSSTSFAQQGHYGARSGPATMGIHLTSYNQFSLSYNGYLYDCFPPSYDIRRINVHLIFHKGTDTKVLVRKMWGTCTTPWNYTAPDLAQYGDYEDTTRDSEFWSLLREVLSGNAVFEVAFEYEGNWDSNYGQNYRLNFIRE